MGAWNFALERIQKILPRGYKLDYVGRLPSASPAAGVFQLHIAERDLLLRQAFN